MSSNGYGWGPIPPPLRGWKVKVVGAVNNLECAEGLTKHWLFLQLPMLQLQKGGTERRQELQDRKGSWWKNNPPLTGHS